MPYRLFSTNCLCDGAPLRAGDTLGLAAAIDHPVGWRQRVCVTDVPMSPWNTLMPVRQLGPVQL